MVKRSTAYLIGLAAVLTLVVLTVRGLDRQGVYYDELHQAPGAFRYLGKNPQMFTWVVNDFLVLNTAYGGAIKSHVYGLYLLVSRHFTVYSWRLLGIIFVAGGLLAFYGIAGRFVPWGTSLIFAGLLLTDSTVLLTTRYDWGPTALALAIRLTLIAVWLSLEFGEDTPGKRFAAGLLVGLALWEKLIAFALLAPSLLMLTAGRRLNRRTLIATAAGGLLGIFPVIYANYSSYRHWGGLISLERVDPTQGWGWSGAKQYASEFLRIGHGEGVGAHVLGSYSRPFWPQAELYLMLLMLGLIALMAVAGWKRTDKHTVVAGKIAAAYVLMAVLLFLTPQGTNVHHWIQATPFQYAAIALALGGPARRSVARLVLGVLVSAMLLVRLPNVAYAESAIADGKASAAFDPIFTRLGEMAAARSKEATFLAADWGTATQIYCLGNGDDELVYETFWDSDPARATRSVLEQTRKNTVYVIATGMVPAHGEAAKSVINAVATSPDWTESPIEKEFSELARFQIRKFERRQR